MNVTCFNQTQVGAFGKHQKSFPSRKEAAEQYISIWKHFALCSWMRSLKLPFLLFPLFRSEEDEIFMETHYAYTVEMY